MPEIAFRRTVLVFVLINVLLGASDKLLGVGYILRMNEQGLNPATISWVLAGGSVVLAVVDFPAGALADMWGRRRIAALGSAVLGAGMVIWALATTALLFLLAISCWAAGTGLISGAPSAWLASRLETLGASDSRTRILSRTSSLALLVGAAAALIAIPLLSHGAKMPLYASAGAAFAAAVVLISGRDQSRGTSVVRRRLIRTVWHDARAVVRDPSMRLVMAKNGLRQVGFTSFILSYQLFVIKQLGLPESGIGAVLAVSILALAAGMWLAPMTANRLGLGRTSAAGTVLATAGYLLMSLAPHWAMWSVGLVAFEVGLGVDLAAFGSWMHEFIPDDKRATWLSAGTSIQTLVGIIGTVGTGTLIERIGYRPVWLGATAFCGASAIPLLALQRRLAIRASEPASPDPVDVATP